jgi:two-component system, chemotaxis family, protein-glutamate methylesterase/glutaminase
MSDIRVLVVDDSFFMRQAISKILQSAGMEVVGEARNGKEAIEQVAKLKPSVVTMDIEMPVMTGIEALKEIMKTNPVPVLMVSTLTSEGADSTIEALSHGAVDFIPKKAGFKEMDSMKEILIDKVRSVGGNTSLSNHFIRKRLLSKMTTKQGDIPTRIITKDQTTSDKENKYYIAKKTKPSQYDLSVIGIGISTGGPPALNELLKHIPDNLPVPILIVQHMPAYFTKSLADRLNKVSPLNIKEAEDKDKLRPGTVYIGKGGMQMSINSQKRILITEEPKGELFKPSVNVMMSSLVNAYGKSVLAVMMTGMGNDGFEGFKKVDKAGGYIIAQDPDTCIVSGMASAVIGAKIANEVTNIEGIAKTICNIFGVSYIN